MRELIIAPVREHSRKPDEIYRRVEALSNGPYLELFARQLRVRPRPRHERVQIVDADSRVVTRRGGDRHDLLREHVKRVPRNHGRLDQPGAHPGRHDRAFQ